MNNALIAVLAPIVIALILVAVGMLMALILIKEIDND